MLVSLSYLLCLFLQTNPIAGQSPSVWEDVTYNSGEVKIAGTLMLPSSGSSFPAVLLVSGDGATTRKERMLVKLGDHLNGLGFATLRTDKRGVGLSTGKLEIATTGDLADDAEAGLEFLRQDDRLDPDRVGIVGHSEGALIAAIVAARSDKVAFSALLAHPTVGIEEILHLQRDKRLRSKGASRRLIAFERDLWKAIFDAVREDLPETRIMAILDSLIVARPADLAKEYGGLQRDPVESVREWFPELKTAWVEWLLDYVPLRDVAAIRCPTLALFCEKDWQVPPEENRAAMVAALDDGDRRMISVQVLPGLNHHFQEAETGSPDEYEHLEIGPSTTTLVSISMWLAEGWPMNTPKSRATSR